MINRILVNSGINIFMLSAVSKLEDTFFNFTDAKEFRKA